jgi:hypothetical protein
MSEKQFGQEITHIEYLMKFCCWQNDGAPIQNILDGSQVSFQNGQYTINTNFDWSNALIPNSIGAFILKCGVVKDVLLERYGENPNFARFLDVLNQDIFRVTNESEYNPRLCNNLQKEYSDALNVWYNTGGQEKIETVGSGKISNQENINKEIGENNIFGIDLYEFNKLPENENLPQRIQFKVIVEEYENILNVSTASPDVLQKVKQTLDILKDSLRYQTIERIIAYTIYISKL